MSKVRYIVTGDTYDHREKLRDLGWRWNKRRRVWEVVAEAGASFIDAVRNIPRLLVTEEALDVEGPVRLELQYDEDGHTCRGVGSRQVTSGDGSTYRDGVAADGWCMLGTVVYNVSAQYGNFRGYVYWSDSEATWVWGTERVNKTGYTVFDRQWATSYEIAKKMAEVTVKRRQGEDKPMSSYKRPKWDVPATWGRGSKKG